MICTSHTYQDKIDNILRAKEAGLQVCSGILGMGESWEDRIDMALSLAELEVDSIPLNLLTPIPGTPLEQVEPISQEDVLRAVALFRYINQPPGSVWRPAGVDFPMGARRCFAPGPMPRLPGIC